MFGHQKMNFLTLFGGAVALASSVYAVQNATFCTDNNSICYAVNVPASTASNGGEGDLYFQISGPSTMRWIGFGQGDQMAGANMFVIYADESGTNITLSPRHGITEVEPLEDPTTNATLLEGSGIANGMIIANVLCTSCNKWTGGDTMNFNNSKAGFIWSYLIGSPINSNSKSAVISQHDLMGTATFDLAIAAGGSAANPFLSTTADSNPSTGESGGGRGPGRGGPGPFSGSSGASGDESEVGRSNYFMILKTHGVIGPLAFAVFFPLGAMAIRLFSFPGLVYVHATWQIMALLLTLTTLGLGIWLSNELHYKHRSHALIGIVAISAVCIQPITGLTHHFFYRSRGISPNIATYPHVWWGRAAVTLGIINGGLGLQLANDTHGGEVAYGIVAGIMWTAWMITIFIAFLKNRDGRRGVSKANETRALSEGERSPAAGAQQMRYR